jgi:serine/threonine protein kinase
VVTRGNDKEGTNNAWDIEARALANINKLNHSHITNCIAAIRRGDSRYFMFPWAEGGSLRDYWDEHPKQTPTAELILQIIQQLRGLADALDSLHNCHNASLPVDDRANHPAEQPLKSPEVVIYDEDDDMVEHVDNVSQKSIRHGDLKPENILRFMNEKLGLGTLKIADMGLAKQHIVNTQDRKQLTSTRYGTIQYEAPEVVTIGGGRSRLYDVWSMGCITLEFIIWVLHGNDVLNSFYSQIKGNTQQLHRYFEISDAEEVERTGLRARVHPVVLQWIEHLHEKDPECSQDSALRDLLTVVHEQLLVINLPVDRASAMQGGRMLAPPALGETETRYRATAAQFRDALDRILHKINASKTNKSGYHFKGISRSNVTVPVSQISGPNLAVPGAVIGTLAAPRAVETANASNNPQAKLLTGVRDRSTRTADYTLPPLKDWEFIVDNKFVDDLLLPRVEYEALVPHAPQPAQLCDRCTSLDFWIGGFTLIDDWSALESRAEQCDFCRLLSSFRPEGGSGSGLIQLERKQSNLVPTAHPFPTLSIFRAPGE